MQSSSSSSSSLRQHCEEKEREEEEEVKVTTIHKQITLCLHSLLGFVPQKFSFHSIHSAFDRKRVGCFLRHSCWNLLYPLSSRLPCWHLQILTPKGPTWEEQRNNLTMQGTTTTITINAAVVVARKKCTLSSTTQINYRNLSTTTSIFFFLFVKTKRECY